MDDFLLRASLGAAFLGAACGPVGCLVLWRRMAYLGESVAHMGLLGAGLGILIGIAPLWGVAALAIAAALLMARADTTQIPSGTMVGLIGHVGLALGFILLSTMENVRADLMGYLFGDVLALSGAQLVLIGAVSAGILASLYFLWRPLLAATVNADIAAAEGASNRITEIAFLVLVAALVAFGLKVVGVLLIVALLLIPPAAARGLAHTPEQMALIAACIGALAAPFGIAVAYAGDLPAGPSIVLAAAALFVVSLLAAPLRKRAQS